MPVFWGKAGLKADYESGESFKHMKKSYEIYTLTRSPVPGDGETAEPSLYQRIPQLVERTSTRVSLSGMKTEEASKADPSYRSAFHFHSLMTEKEGFTNTVKERRLQLL